MALEDGISQSVEKETFGLLCPWRKEASTFIVGEAADASYEANTHSAEDKALEDDNAEKIGLATKGSTKASGPQVKDKAESVGMKKHKGNNKKMSEVDDEEDVPDTEIYQNHETTSEMEGEAACMAAPKETSVVEQLLSGADREEIVVVVSMASACPEDDACEEICALYYANGDPTEGHRSQHPTVFVDHGKAQVEFECADGVQLEIAQQIDQLRHAGVTGCVVWAGAVVLAKSLTHWVDSGLLCLEGLRVLELGAGTGLLSLAVAALGARVVASEQQERLRLLRKNVDKNASGPPWKVGRRGGTIEHIIELDWFGNVERCNYDLVLATDVVYTEEVTSAFVRCLSLLGDIPAIVAVELRTEEVHYAFITSLAIAGYVVSRLPVEMLPVDVRTRKVVTYVLTLGGRKCNGSLV